MKLKTAIRRNIRLGYAFINFFRFWLLRRILGFDVANQFIQRVDKISLHLILRKNGVTIGKNCDIESGLVFHNCRNYSNFIIGDNCHIGKNCFFDLRDKVILKDNVVISMKCTFITHLDMSKSDLNRFYPPEQAGIEIQDNVYIGANSTVLNGVTIKKDTLIAACSLVNANIDSNLIIGGIPAKKIKSLNNGC